MAETNRTLVNILMSDVSRLQPLRSPSMRFRTVSKVIFKKKRVPSSSVGRVVQDIAQSSSDDDDNDDNDDSASVDGDGQLVEDKQQVCQNSKQKLNVVCQLLKAVSNDFKSIDIDNCTLEEFGLWALDTLSSLSINNKTGLHSQHNDAVVKTGINEQMWHLKAAVRNIERLCDNL